MPYVISKLPTLCQLVIAIHDEGRRPNLFPHRVKEFYRNAIFKTLIGSLQTLDLFPHTLKLAVLTAYAIVQGSETPDNFLESCNLSSK